MEKLVIMDHSDRSVEVYNINDTDPRSIENIVEHLGHRVSECDFMWCERISFYSNA